MYERKTNPAYMYIFESHFLVRYSIFFFVIILYYKKENIILLHSDFQISLICFSFLAEVGVMYACGKKSKLL